MQILSEPRAGTAVVPTPAYGEPDEEEEVEEMGDYFAPRMRGPPPPSFAAAQGGEAGNDGGASGGAGGADLPPDYSVAPPPPRRDRVDGETGAAHVGWRDMLMPPGYSRRAVVSF